MNTYVKVHNYRLHEYFPECNTIMNIARVPPLLAELQNEFHLQPSSLFARNLHWTRDENGKTMAKGGGQPPGTR